MISLQCMSWFIWVQFLKRGLLPTYGNIYPWGKCVKPVPCRPTAILAVPSVGRTFLYKKPERSSTQKSRAPFTSLAIRLALIAPLIDMETLSAVSYSLMAVRLLSCGVCGTQCTDRTVLVPVLLLPGSRGRVRDTHTSIRKKRFASLNGEELSCESGHKM